MKWTIYLSLGIGLSSKNKSGSLKVIEYQLKIFIVKLGEPDIEMYNVL